jgi:hypothetical protein
MGFEHQTNHHWTRLGYYTGRPINNTCTSNGFLYHISIFYAYEVIAFFIIIHFKDMKIWYKKPLEVQVLLIGLPVRYWWISWPSLFNFVFLYMTENRSNDVSIAVYLMLINFCPLHGIRTPDKPSLNKIRLLYRKTN